ncbi:CBS domain-containing protein [Candidatus Pacearchaeota archaeon]|nr:CBS domain-containing protein [Candidatus Pacearchaeota archaeon]
MSRIIVADIMTRDPIIIEPETSLFDCAKKMVKKRVGSLLLAKGKKLVGFVSEEDILWALVKKSRQDLSKIKAIDISPRKIATIKPESSIEETIKKMKKLKFERLPVIHNGELVGLITTRDIINFNPQVYPELKEFEEIREESKKLKRIQIAKTRELVHEGVCEECGNTDILFKLDGRLICEGCKNLM